MFLKQRKTSTDPRLRSLLQKAARRGYPNVVERVARCLDAQGDRTWLRSRAAVITFEECWPLQWGREGAGHGNFTAWELSQVVDNPKLRLKTTFYNRGTKVDIDGL